MESIIKVDGMMCAGCEKRVMGAIGKLNGVQSCTASAKDNEVCVSYDESILTRANITDTIEEIGYDIVD